MIKKSIVPLMVLLGFVLLVKAQQVEVINGPNLTNDPDSKVNRLIDGDENSFYCYRVRSKGKGTSFFIEKYNKASLKPEFSKEVGLADDRTKLEDIIYASGVVYVFSRQYDKEKDKMSLNIQTITSAGVISPKKTNVTSVISDHYEFVEFDISTNPSKTKFLIKSSHKANKDDVYFTDFILMGVSDLKTEFTKTVQGKLFSETITINLGFGITISPESEFLGLVLDDQDNIFYAYTELVKEQKGKKYILRLGNFAAGSKEARIIDMPFDSDYLVSDIDFLRNKSNEIVVAGFLKDIEERKGSDLIKCGIFSFTVNTEQFKVSANAVKLFDDQMLKRLESNPRRSKYFKYKLDYILPVGNDVFYVGEQYGVRYTQSRNMAGMGTWNYEYMDVIVAKRNSTGEFEWVANAPLRNNLDIKYSHVFKQYFAVATAKNIYIFNNDHPANLERYKKPDFEAQDLKNITAIHGSSFVFSAISTSTGAVTHQLIFENETYCFAPIQERNPQFLPPADAEIFVMGSNNEYYVYTEDRGKDRFTKLKIKE